MFSGLVARILQAIGLLTVLAVLVGAGAFLLLTPWLQVQDEPQPAEYIVVLAGDGHRLIRAAELYKQGLAPRVVISNERVRPPTRYDSVRQELGLYHVMPRDARLTILEHLGVPRAAVEAIGEGLISTADEAEAFRRRFGGKSGTAIVVASPFQARRAKIVFETEMPGMRWLIVWPPERSLPERWWTDQDAAVSAITELAKLMNYWIGGAFRSDEGDPARAKTSDK